jgi:poly(A) polymerase
MDMQTFATEAVKKLVGAGYLAYFAGGWVRDYLMDHPSSDIDIATDAPPEVIIKLFPNTIHVGAAFGVYIVPHGKEQIEIAIFRKDVEYAGGRRPTRIETSTPEEDALRRDFTINGMFYDPLKDVVHDWVQGAEDIKKGIIRAIGNPDQRFFEDRLRMIRAVRFATRFGFAIEPETQQAIIDNAESLFPAVSMERIWQEFHKMSHYHNFDHAIVELHRLKLLGEVFPELKSIHLNDIKKRVSAYHAFPNRSPLVAYLIQLFPDKNLVQMEETLRQLKASTKDVKLAHFLMQGEELLSKTEKREPIEWVRFYADPHADLCLEMHAATHTLDRKDFFHSHDARKHKLSAHIDRIKNKKPLVTSEHIKNEGIPSGKIMGDILKEAERLTINKDLKEPNEVIQELKRTLVWPQVM